MDDDGAVVNPAIIAELLAAAPDNYIVREPDEIAGGFAYDVSGVRRSTFFPSLPDAG